MSAASYRKYIRETTPECIDHLFDQSREAEAAYLSLAMQDPYEAYLAAAEHEVSDADFVYPEHKRLFMAVMESAEVGVRRWGFDLFHAWNRDERYLFGDLIDEAGKFWLGPDESGSSDDLAFRVRDLSTKRQVASAAARAMATVYGVEHAGTIVERIIAEIIRPQRLYQLPAQSAQPTRPLKGRAVA